MTIEEKRAHKREYMKQCRESARKHGVCIMCLKNKAEPNRTYCCICYEKKHQYFQNKIKDPQQAKEFREKRKVSYQKYYNKSKENGSCVKCSKPAYKGHSLCYEHMLQSRRLNKEKYVPGTKKEGWRTEGLCVKCGKETVPGKKLCTEHMEKALAALEKARANIDRENHPWRKDEDARHKQFDYKKQRILY